jgi:GntR family transcriptional regulator/MocR family aminotransferase
MYIVENDYDSEFRYAGPPISSLHLLDPESVIHIGTFSESLYPSLRLGYMILPEPLLKECQKFMALNSLVTSALKQVALTAFIEGGYLERHITKMKKLYREKREMLIACLQKAFGDQISISGDSTGLYVVVEFKQITFSDEVIERIQQQNVRIYPVEDHAIRKGLHKNKILLGYGNLPIEKIPTGIECMKNALDSCHPQSLV